MPRTALAVRLTTFASLLAFSSLAIAQAPASQSQPPRAPTPVFTADDALEINTTSIGDMSDDGRWLAPAKSPTGPARQPRPSKDINQVARLSFFSQPRG
jgi:hypothetical protein